MAIEIQAGRAMKTSTVESLTILFNTVSRDRL